MSTGKTYEHDFTEVYTVYQFVPKLSWGNDDVKT